MMMQFYNIILFENNPKRAIDILLRSPLPSLLYNHRDAYNWHIWHSVTEIWLKPQLTEVKQIEKGLCQWFRSFDCKELQDYRGVSALRNCLCLAEVLHLKSNFIQVFWIRFDEIMGGIDKTSHLSTKLIGSMFSFLFVCSLDSRISQRFKPFLSMESELRNFIAQKLIYFYWKRNLIKWQKLYRRGSHIGRRKKKRKARLVALMSALKD